MSFSLHGFDLDRFIAATLAEDLGQGGDITSEAVIPAYARFRGVMDSRDAIRVAGLEIAEAFSGRSILRWRLRVWCRMGTASPPERT